MELERAHPQSRGWLFQGGSQTAAVSGCIYLMTLILYFIPYFKDFNNKMVFLMEI